MSLSFSSFISLRNFRTATPRLFARAGSRPAPKRMRKMRRMRRISPKPMDPMSISCRQSRKGASPCQTRGSSGRGWGHDAAKIAVPSCHTDGVEMLQERDGILAGGPGEILESGDIHHFRGCAVFPEPPLQGLERLGVEDAPLLDADESPLLQQKKIDALQPTAAERHLCHDLLHLRRVEPGIAVGLLDSSGGSRFLASQLHPMACQSHSIQVHAELVSLGRFLEKKPKDFRRFAAKQPGSELFFGKTHLERLAAMEGFDQPDHFLQRSFEQGRVEVAWGLAGHLNHAACEQQG